MDIISVIGSALAVLFVLFGILTGGSILTFIDIPSIFIVFGGTIGSLLLSSKKENVKQLFKLFSLVFREKSTNSLVVIEMLARWSMKARKEGLMGLEQIAEEVSDPFIKKGLMMVVDGIEPQVVRTVLGLKMRGINERHKNNRSLLDTGAALAPAFGMIGTLIGLINMLKTLSDPSTIGPQMAVALITTFYGSMLANMLFMPMSKKLKANTAEELFQKEMIVEGLISIQSGENTNVMREKLLAFLGEDEVEVYGKQYSIQNN
ncbi:MotA/TolQ/ExbB proton channel family protein [Clostridium sp. A1-XYC3]|uniref:MotA/TolQ/ExbB proton channel family protein n=1 Tax=Clostridium tanneri TaxID=3037988 RepID=A0ABU4JUP8_9CLOT|nr:MotA/TolQ/ExbB proton channel family protein [Clostridium sp. A1-XYC3]MDW8801885.1 MotA/TolQ/ExbB proton channel family protein [Clostridium sp. A1-XYC3]